MAADQLSVTLTALADPTRRAILARLARGDATVSELAAPFDLSLPGVSKHLKVLRRAGLVSQGQKAQWRPCRLEAEPLREVERVGAASRQHWEDSFDRLDDLLDQLRQEEPDG